MRRILVTKPVALRSHVDVVRVGARVVARVLTAVAIVAVVGALGFTTEVRAQTVEQFQLDHLTSLTGTNGFNRASCDTPTKDHIVDLRVTGLQRDDYLMRFIEYPTTAPQQPCPTNLTLPDQTVIGPTDQDAPSPGGNFVGAIHFTTAQLVGADNCTGNGALEHTNFCVQFYVLPNDINAVLTSSIPLDIDTILPPTPTVTSIDTTDTGITFHFATPDTTDGETFTFVLQYRKCPASSSSTGEGEGEGEGQALTVAEGEGEGDASSKCGATGDFVERTSSDPTIALSGFTANQKIEWRALLRDAFNNESAPTPLAIAETIADLGPLDLYQGAGSSISCAPSCGTGTSTADAGTATDAGAVLFVLGLTRRGRKVLAKIAKKGASAFFVVMLLFAFTASTKAHADLGQMTIGMSLSPYKPNIDSETVDGKPIFPMYGCIYGGKTITEIGGDIDEHLLDDFGSLQLSFGLNISQAQGFAQPTSLLSTHKCGTATKTAVQLTMLKLRPGITYRFDPALDAWGIPLVPYARLGLVGQGYMFTKNGDFDKGSGANAANPVGMRFGWEGAVGLMLALDFLETAGRSVVRATDTPGLRIISDNVDLALPDSTRRGRANGTFDHTFLYVEGAYQPIAGFGQPGFVFSNQDTWFNTGLPILWKIGIAVELL